MLSISRNERTVTENWFCQCEKENWFCHRVGQPIFFPFFKFTVIKSNSNRLQTNNENHSDGDIYEISFRLVSWYCN